jgi:hypothetical protein
MTLDLSLGLSIKIPRLLVFDLPNIERLAEVRAYEPRCALNFVQVENRAIALELEKTAYMAKR